MQPPNIKNDIRAFYLDYVNNYLTIAKLAEDYGIDPEAARHLIDWGRQYHNEHAALMREIDRAKTEQTTGA